VTGQPEPAEAPEAVHALDVEAFARALGRLREIREETDRQMAEGRAKTMAAIAHFRRLEERARRR
jgi:hypothetical protein